MINKISLFDSYYLSEISQDEFGAFVKEHGDVIFQDLLSFEVGGLLSHEEKIGKERLATALGTPFTLYYGIFHNDSLIGGSFGKQETSERFYMVSTAIVSEHQNKGIYRRFIPVILNRAKQEGFQIVYSRHRATHNAVIVPKLKAGFQITSLEISDRYGPLVHLSYYFNDARRELLEFRSGRRLSEEKMRTYLKGNIFT